MRTIKRNLTQEQDVHTRLVELEEDLRTTEYLFKRFTRKNKKEAINKLRIPLIVAHNKLRAYERSQR